MAELQEAAGMGVHAVELTPATLAPVLPDLKLKGQIQRSSPADAFPSLPAIMMYGSEVRARASKVSVALPGPGASGSLRVRVTVMAMEWSV